MKPFSSFLLMASVAVAASGCTLLGTMDAPPSAPPVRIVKVSDNAFDPDSMNTVPAPTTVTWEWVPGSTNLHNVTFDSLSIVAGGGALVNSPTQGAGAVFSLQFGKPGIFTYYCTVHPDMKGIINVRPDLCENGCPIFP